MAETEGYNGAFTGTQIDDAILKILLLEKNGLSAESIRVYDTDGSLADDVNEMLLRLTKYASEKIITVRFDMGSIRNGGVYLQGSDLHVRLEPLRLPDEYGVVSDYVFDNTKLSPVYVLPSNTLSRGTITFQPPDNYWLGYPGTTADLKLGVRSLRGTPQDTLYTGKANDTGGIVYTIQFTPGDFLEYYLAPDNVYDTVVPITLMLN